MKHSIVIVSTVVFMGLDLNVFAVSKVALGGQCTMRDMCLSDAAYCRDGVCACFVGYSARNGTCGKDKRVERSAVCTKH